MRTLPCYEAILRGLSLYDVVGFQTERDLWAFQDCLTQPEIGGAVLEDGRVSAFGRTFHAGVFPIGIDAGHCARLAQQNMKHSKVRRLSSSIGERKLIIGVDRLDYSKGLELRFRAFEELLADYPTARGKVSYLQIAPPTLSEVSVSSSSASPGKSPKLESESPEPSSAQASGVQSKTTR
jgi:trehalose 6-phosphate synthase